MKPAGDEKTCGMLYLCATPIGNLSDITERVLHTLQQVDLIACEDTRTSRKLFSHFNIRTPFTAYHHHNRYDKARELIAQLKDGRTIALVTDAGTPSVSDPGEELVKLCHDEGIPVTSLPGACALVTALSASGLSAGRFVFEGFLPGKNRKKERMRILRLLRREERTIILYEAPHHLRDTLQDLYDTLGNRTIALCRELTKQHEEFLLTGIGEALRDCEAKDPRGEYVLVIEGYAAKVAGQITPEASGADTLSETGADGPDTADDTAAGDGEDMAASFLDESGLGAMSGEEILKTLLLQLDIPSHVAFYEAKGMARKEAMRAAASDRGVSRRDIYAALLQ